MQSQLAPSSKHAVAQAQPLALARCRSALSLARAADARWRSADPFSRSADRSLATSASSASRLQALKTANGSPPRPPAWSARAVDVRPSPHLPRSAAAALSRSASASRATAALRFSALLCARDISAA